MYDFNLKTIIPYFNKLPAAIWQTMELSLLAIVLSMIVGIIFALMRRSDSTTLRGLGALYVEIIRNMPLLVLVYLVYFGLPQTGWVPDSFVCALIALTLNSGAFMTEIFRAGLIAVPKGQYEAARSQGMTRIQMFRYVILPQILRVSYAPLGNQLIGVIMGSSIATVIGVEEVTSWMSNTGAITYRYFETFFVVCIVYLVLCQMTNAGRILIGRYLFKSSAAGGEW